MFGDGWSQSEHSEKKNSCLYREYVDVIVVVVIVTGILVLTRQNNFLLLLSAVLSDIFPQIGASLLQTTYADLWTFLEKNIYHLL